jgi:hypothetical protein
MWHDEIYLNDPSMDNVFGREALAPRRAPLLLEFLRRGGCLADFPRHQPSARLVEIFGQALKKTD